MLLRLLLLWVCLLSLATVGVVVTKSALFPEEEEDPTACDNIGERRQLTPVAGSAFVEQTDSVPGYGSLYSLESWSTVVTSEGDVFRRALQDEAGPVTALDEDAVSSTAVQLCSCVLDVTSKTRAS